MLAQAFAVAYLAHFGQGPSTFVLLKGGFYLCLESYCY